MAKLASSCVSYLTYLGKSVWPSAVVIFYPYRTYLSGLGLGAFIGLVMISYTCYQYKRAHPQFLFAWIWFLVALLPVIGFIQVGGQAIADRWSLWPHVGLIIGLIGGLQSAKMDRLVIYFLLGACLLVSSLKTYIEIPYWKNSVTLFSRALDIDSDNFMAHTNLGQALAAQGNLKKARYHYEEAVRLNPTYPVALNNLGTALAQNREYERATDLFRRALFIEPGQLMLRYNLGLVLYESGQILKGLAQWIQILNNNPNFGLAKNSLNTAVGNQLLQICNAYMHPKDDGVIELRNQLAKIDHKNSFLSWVDQKLQTCSPY